MAYTKQTFTAGQTLKANDLNTMSQGIVDAYQLASLGGSGSASKELKILFIGNSLTQDAVSYLPLLLDEIAPEVKYTIYDWYNGGHTLAQQYSKFTAKTPCENFGTITNSQEGGWTTQRNEITMDWVCQNCNFDVVVIQEYSYYDFTDSVEVTNFNNVVNYIRTNYNKPFKVFSFIDAPMRTRIASDYEKAKKYAKLHITESVSEGLVNPGSAVIYALKDALLKDLGDKGQLSADGTHTQEGLPCMLQSYVLALWVFEWLGIPKSVLNSNTKMTADLYSRWASFGPNLGTGVVEGSPAQYDRAQEIAIKAHKYGKQLFDIFIGSLADESDKPTVEGGGSGGVSGEVTSAIYKADAFIAYTTAIGAECAFTANQYSTEYDVYKVSVSEGTKYTLRVSHGLKDDRGHMPVIAVCDANGTVVGIINTKINSQDLRTETYVVNTAEYEGASYLLVSVYNSDLEVSIGDANVIVTVANEGAMIKNSTLAVGSLYEPSTSQYTTDYNIYRTEAINKPCSLVVKHAFYSASTTNTPVVLVCDSSGNVLEIIRTKTNVQKERVESYIVDMSQYATGSYFVFNALANEYCVATVA